jgi:Protein of unknown function (DUF2846)
LRILIVMCLFVSLAGCAATGRAYEAAPAPAEDRALVYIYRPPTFVGSALNADFYIDGAKAARLNTNGYTWLHVPTGSHVLLQRFPTIFRDIPDPDNAISLNVIWEPGQTYFYRLEIGAVEAVGPHTMGIPYRISRVPPDVGEGEIRMLRYQVAELPEFGAQGIR